MGKRESRPWIVSDELWSLIEPLLPEPGPKLVAGRPAMIQDSAGKHPLYPLTKRLEADTASVPLGVTLLSTASFARGSGSARRADL